MISTLLRKPPAKDAFPETVSPVTVIGLQGEYNVARREELLAKLQAIPTCDIAIIDMRQVTQIDETALTYFIQLRKRLRRNGPGIVRIVGLSPGLDRVYEFETFESIGDAMGEYGYTVNANEYE
jgi:anti-anti-sigma regulatory factor